MKKRARTKPERRRGTLPIDAIEPLLAAWPAPTAVEQRAFLAHLPEKKCDALGRGSDPSGVLAEAIAWAHAIDGALRLRLPELRGYTPTRFAWFLRCVQALAIAREDHEVETGGAADAERIVAKALAAGERARSELVDTLERVAGEVDEEVASLAAARAKVDSPRGLLASLGAVIALAEDWLGRAGEESKALVEACGLRRGEVDEASAVHGVLEAAVNGAWARGDVRDARAIPRAEGRVLLEMRLAMRAFDRARKTQPSIPSLTPGPATRRALSGTRAGEGEPTIPAAKRRGAR